MKGVLVARQRPTASDEQASPRLRDATGSRSPDVLTRAQAHALSRCAPLRRASPAAASAARSAHWEAPAEPTRVGQLRREVASFASRAGLPDSVLPELQVAVSEALTNAVLHAYCDRETDQGVRVDAEVTGRELLVRVRDYGRGIQPRPDSPGMGLGLSMIARLCKRHSIRRGDGGRGTEVGMCFDLGRRDAGARSNGGAAR